LKASSLSNNSLVLVFLYSEFILSISVVVCQTDNSIVETLEILEANCYDCCQ
jgi:hypothetical protein